MSLRAKLFCDEADVFYLVVQVWRDHRDILLCQTMLGAVPEFRQWNVHAVAISRCARRSRSIDEVGNLHGAQYIY